MARKPSIDRAGLLDAAEQIILSRGVGALSFDAIAKAAGVSKGGVQNVFGSKQELLDALFVHLDSGYEQRFEAARSTGATPVQAYVGAATSAQAVVNQRITSLSLAMALEPESRAYLRNWYAQAFSEVDPATPQGRQEILRLCALEGALMLRALQLLPLQEQEWAQVFDAL